MKSLLCKGLLVLAALGATALPASAGSFGLFTCWGCKCGCVVRPYNAFTPPMCANPPCIDNAFPNPCGCYGGPDGAALYHNSPIVHTLFPTAPGLGSPMAGSPMVPFGVAWQQLPPQAPYAGGFYYGPPMPMAGYGVPMQGYGAPTANYGLPAQPFQPVAAPVQPVHLLPLGDQR